MNQNNSLDLSNVEDQALKDMVTNLIVNRFSDDLQFIKKLNKITFGLITNNDR